MSTLDLSHPLKLSNGLTLSICDHTRAYFGGYHLVKLEIIFAFDAAVGDGKLSGADCADLRKFSYNRCLERMGVHSSAVESVKKTLLKDFKDNSLPYMSSAEFPQRLLEKELFVKKASVRKYLGADS